MSCLDIHTTKTKITKIYLKISIGRTWFLSTRAKIQALHRAGTVTSLGREEAIAWIYYLYRLFFCFFLDTKAKCRHLTKFTCKATLRQVFIFLRPSPLLGFCQGWSSDFVGSESGQIQSVKLLQNVVSNRIQLPHPLPATQCLCVLYFDTGKGVGGRVEPQRRLEGQQFTKQVDNNNVANCFSST